MAEPPAPGGDTPRRDRDTAPATRGFPGRQRGGEHSETTTGVFEKS